MILLNIGVVGLAFVEKADSAIDSQHVDIHPLLQQIVDCGAIAFLYSGPAISILSIILTARILGVEMGVARTVGAIGFSVVIALLWHLFSVRKRKPNKRNR